MVEQAAFSDDASTAAKCTGPDADVAKSSWWLPLAYSTRQEPEKASARLPRACCSSCHGSRLALWGASTRAVAGAGQSSEPLAAAPEMKGMLCMRSTRQ